MSLRNRPRVIVAVIAVLIVAGGALALAYHYRPKTISPAGGNATKNQPAGYSDVATPTPQPASSSSATQASSAPQPVSNLSKPTLQKSSGNAPGSSVPAGAAMEFTCEGTLGANCQIVITSKTNAANVITLPSKAIASNGRGSYFATWTWAAISGSWTIQAKTTNSSGAITVSDAQSLEVK